VLVLETADDRHLLLERFQRLEHGTELERLALGGRRPLRHDRAVRQVDEPHVHLGGGGGLRERRAGRNHRVQERQRDRRAHAAQHRAA
jgi:hypothetical protein